mmetsp:Transcript_31420/g.66720  ORF Transcript_31420/g.66720 Transcript_31420/m.66720 type:complete len:204 (-) Transcript_31420:104-715(-)
MGWTLYSRPACFKLSSAWPRTPSPTDESTTRRHRSARSARAKAPSLFNGCILRNSKSGAALLVCSLVYCVCALSCLLVCCVSLFVVVCLFVCLFCWFACLWSWSCSEGSGSGTSGVTFLCFSRAFSFLCLLLFLVCFVRNRLFRCEVWRGERALSMEARFPVRKPCGRGLRKRDVSCAQETRRLGGQSQAQRPTTGGSVKTQS